MDNIENNLTESLSDSVIECHVCYEILQSEEYTSCIIEKCTYIMCYECAIKCKNCPQCQSDIVIPPDLVIETTENNSTTENNNTIEHTIPVYDTTYPTSTDTNICMIWRIIFFLAVFVLMFHSDF